MVNYNYLILYKETQDEPHLRRPPHLARYPGLSFLGQHIHHLIFSNYFVNLETSLFWARKYSPFLFTKWINMNYGLWINRI